MPSSGLGGTSNIVPTASNVCLFLKLDNIDFIYFVII